MKKLNFGCGSIQPDGWFNVDSNRSFAAIYTTTRTFVDNDFDLIVAHAVLQQIPLHEFDNQLLELKRVLKPGGTLRVSLPDIRKGFTSLIKNDLNWFPNSELDIEDAFSHWLTWYSTSVTLLTQVSLRNRLFKNGFSEVHINAKFDPIKLDTREGEFYFTEAVK